MKSFKSIISYDHFPLISSLVITIFEIIQQEQSSFNPGSRQGQQTHQQTTILYVIYPSKVSEG